MPDDSLDLLVRTTADTAGIDATTAGLGKNADALRSATAEAERYSDALRKMAMADKSAAEERRRAADETERYQSALQRMSQEQTERQGNKGNGETEKWMAGMAERRSAVEAGKNAAAAVRDESNATAELTDKTKFLNLSKGELKKLVGELGREFPAAGMAARAMMNPLTLAVSAAIAGFIAAKKGLNDWNAEMDKAEQAAAQRDFLPGIEAKKEALRQATISLIQFHTELGAIGKDRDPIADKFSGAIAKAHGLLAAMAELDNAEKARDISEVNTKERLGQISPEKAIEQRSAISEKYRKRAEETKTAEENYDLAAKEQELAERKAKSQALESDALNKKAAFGKAQAELADAKSNIPSAEEQEKKLKPLIEDAEKQREKAKSVAALASNPETFVGPDDVKAAEAEAEKAEARVAAQRRLWEQAKKRRDELEQDVIPRASSEDRRADATARQNAERISALEHEIETLKKTIPIRQRARSKASSALGAAAENEELGELAATGTGKDLAQAARGAEIIQAAEKARTIRANGKRLSAEEEKALIDEANLSPETMALIRQFGKYLAGTRASMRELIDAVANANEKTDIMAKDIEIIKRAQARQAAQQWRGR